jgi:hypothetical protein
MEPDQVPAALPAAVVRPRPLITAVMSQSLAELGPGSRTASAWQWTLTGRGHAPVTGTPGRGLPPATAEITAETEHGTRTSPPECGWPPWRHARDPDPDRQQARRVLRWLTGAADAIPLFDPGRGRHAGARFHLARTDTDIRRVRASAAHGLAEHGDLPAHMPAWRAEQPWQWPAPWMNAAWLHGTIAYLDWILGDTPVTPLSGRHAPLHPELTLASPEPDYPLEDLIALRGAGCGTAAIEEELMGYLSTTVMQGHEGQPPAEPGRYPPPQWGEGVQQAHDWATGEDPTPPADHHGCGDYHPCPGQRRCRCDNAGKCLRGQCPACADRTCNAAWPVIQSDH